ncbi:MAG: hypothetical protein HDT20_04980 [Oscillibacter sp.]|nr:hypothetical protein [Oscillibacter sp.]
MRPYQQKYIDNVREIAALTERLKPGELVFEEYAALLRERERQAAEKVKENLELLRRNLLPTVDHLFETTPEDLKDLEDFASQLRGNTETRDEGLFRLIHQALLSLARQRGDRNAMIRELYWLGMGYFDLSSKLVGLGLQHVAKYVSQMRLCFTEAAAYLKYFDEIDDTETRGYILRSRANMSLGLFKSPGEKIGQVRETLRIMQDESYQSKEPDLPWDRYIYTVHQQMATSISYRKEKVMTPEDMASIMDSAYIVYQRRIQETSEKHETPPLRWAFPYYAIEYYCGIYDMDHLLGRVEMLLDAADPADRSPDGMYGILSLPAFYCQYLLQYPERIPGREAYIDSLFRRAMNYADSFASSKEDRIPLYIRHLSYMYLETSSGTPFGEFLQWMMLRFMPEVYLHSWMVGTAAKALCGLILEEEPEFFDDIPEICALTDPQKKRQQVLNDAMQSGLLHDIGKVSVLELSTRTVRQWQEEEYEVTCLHTAAGHLLLSERASTERFAPVALGHHAWYDGSAYGYPATYKRLECPSRQMVDVVGLIDWIEAVTNSDCSHTGIVMTFDEAVEEAIALEGRQFSPLLTARLRDKQVTEKIRQAFEAGRREAYRQMYEQERERDDP